MFQSYTDLASGALSNLILGPALSSESVVVPLSKLLERIQYTVVGNPMASPPAAHATPWQLHLSQNISHIVHCSNLIAAPRDRN